MGPAPRRGLPGSSWLGAGIGTRLAIGLAGSFLLGSLMTLGIGFAAFLVKAPPLETLR